MPEISTSPDTVVELAQKAAKCLEGASDLEAMDAGLTDALEATRQFRAQVDLGGPITPDRLQTFEALFRAANDLQPSLHEAEVDGLTKAAIHKTEIQDDTVARSKMRVRSTQVSHAVLTTLQSAYRAVIHSKETPWPSK